MTASLIASKFNLTRLLMNVYVDENKDQSDVNYSPLLNGLRLVKNKRLLN
jgi:hypothetical protein